MKNLTLTQRLTLIFALLMVVSCAISGWMQVRSSTQYSQAVIQRLSGNLAQHIADSNPLLGQNGLNAQSVQSLFGQLMAVNPSVEVYLLDKQGEIIGNAAPAGHLKRQKVNLQPLQALFNGANMPVYGDDPRNPDAKKVFSAAPLKVNGQVEGYLYVVLLGEDYDALTSSALHNSAVSMALWTSGLMVLFSLLAGGFAFYWVTRPIRRLTRQVSELDSGGIAAMQAYAALPAESSGGRDEVSRLQQAFRSMAQRIAEQWQTLSQQDQQRREFIANISHDLRTPLTSLHGYLETLSVKSASLSDHDRQRYLEIALAQSRKVGRLAQELFELARLEYGVVKPQKEPFSLSELVQDVFQKFELAAEARQQRLLADITPGIPLVFADVSMIERVLTNLLDNAIRHTPQGGEIEVRLWQQAGKVLVQVNDSGPGIPQELRADLFVRPSILSSARRHASGLGLMIVRRILLLHDSDIQLVERPQTGACFRFSIPLR
ncbi:Signal-transduction histidine kinase senX3 [Serratia quinivorans]|jgi:signal transduction histidine kinase|uniref:sensor histidine kinase n=1 Tax=Serratia quinivorans TaxID=137545 RepID=UPI0021786523|nr:HAMP domain-containing sensor histidine kinase [Serratia quinivorans]CAI0760460.1 Signal-transduction histidine kinase senX3 [Serratia quinivorans]CAI0812497.1 Signal-transduction histidine kinase senX3 [Serratia quinivorans]CAI1703065.1 Signal-transduction histidine kinase senX3 [Serratia quinivorans]CAI1789947.1 Signal-transduction histidine kinase senX3 [Serratia quinivorans]CAI2049483.1 Signal-transduction histidine kinase senX3 [Serratia quinivorans]